MSYIVASFTVHNVLVQTMRLSAETHPCMRWRGKGLERGYLPLFSGDSSSDIVRKVTECTFFYRVSQAYLCCVIFLGKV